MQKNKNVIIFLKACWIIHIQTCCNGKAKKFPVFSPIHSWSISCETWKLISFQRNYLLKYIVHGYMQIYNAKWLLETVRRLSGTTNTVSWENRQLFSTNSMSAFTWMQGGTWAGQSRFWHWGYFWISMRCPRRRELWFTLQLAPEPIHCAAQDIFPLRNCENSCSRLKNCINFSSGNGQGWVGAWHLHRGGGLGWCWHCSSCWCWD